jgi:hypothetical protein
VNLEDAKTILLLYRPGTADADDPQIAEALALAKKDESLSRWLEQHLAEQNILRETFRQVAAPDGLKEMIIYEQVKITPLWRREIQLFPLAAAIMISALLALFWFVNHREHRGKDDTLAVFQNQMAGVALRGYAMDLATNDLSQIRAYLAQNHSPSDFSLPESLKRTVLAGCAVEGWQDVKVSMICFRSNHAAPNAASDIWLFVVNRSSIKNLAAESIPHFSRVNRLAVATWVQDDKLYFLGTTGDAKTIQNFL